MTQEEPETDIGLVTLHEADAAAAEAGMAWLRGETTADWGFPVIGLQALGLLHNAGIYELDELYTALVQRYGFLEDPVDPSGPPLGVAVRGSTLQFTCLACHADRVAGEVIVGGSNGSVDWEQLAAELTSLAKVGGVEAPFTLDGFTGAPGSHDAWGLGFELAAQQVPAPVNIDFGFQQSPAWWSRRYKRSLYLDGSGTTEGKRTMAAMYLGYGASLEQIKAMEADLDDAWAAMVRLPVPRWTLTELDSDRWKQGEALFEANCAECHGRYSGEQERTYPDRVEDVGTDPVRHAQMGQTEVDYLNASWFGEDDGFRDTEGYLAPVLHGVWATAPYFHNGAVPTLWSVLDSESRPARWVRTGHEMGDYDVDRVGLVVEEPAEEGTGYDASVAGLGNQGHTFGDALSDDERWAVLEYLKSL